MSRFSNKELLEIINENETFKYPGCKKRCAPYKAKGFKNTCETCARYITEREVES